MLHSATTILRSMTDTIVNQEINWIDSDEQLDKCCLAWSEQSLLALDTEFVRETTYYPIAGLIQVNDGVQTYLIDPLKIDDWYPLIELFEDEQITIAMHSCSEDLEVLQMEVGTVPKNILDTQIAIAFLGAPSSLGYAKLVERELGHVIPKAETRSNWLQRPLSKPQIQYAALDVEYLYTLAENLQSQLKEKGRLDWVREEGRRIYRHFKQLQDVNNSFKRIKSAWKLSPQKLAVLVALSKWRENYAQQKDIPRNRVIKERSLFELALHCPKHVSKLRDIDGMPERIIRSQGDTIIELVKRACELDEESLPSALPAPLAKADQEQYRALKSAIHSYADELDIAPEFVLKKKDIEALFRLQQTDSWTEIDAYFEGWRKNSIADRVQVLLKEL